jgi:membrane protease YdiL (CAAX protease family)
MIRLLRAHPGWAFFVVAWVFSWLFMLPLGLARHGLAPPLPGWLHYLSAYGPLLSAALVVTTTEGTAGLRRWGSRLVRWRVGFWPWALAVSPLALYLLTAAAQRLFTGAWPDVRLLGRLNFLPDIGPWALLLWLGNSGLGEEAGWRGFALPLLQRRLSPRRSSLLIGLGWMAWHIPAFFYLPSYDHFSIGMAVGFFLGILGGSYLLAWLTNGAGGSALLPIVWHGLFNFTTAPPSSGPLIAPVISTACLVLGVVAIFALRAQRR